MTRPHYVQLLGPFVRNPFVIGVGLVCSGFLVSIVVPGVFGMNRNWALWLFAICMTPTLVYADYLGSVRGISITIAVWFIAGSHFLIWDLAAWLHLDKSFLHMRPDHHGWQWAIGFARYAGGFYLGGAAHTWINRLLARRRTNGPRPA